MINRRAFMTGGGLLLGMSSIMPRMCLPGLAAETLQDVVDSKVGPPEGLLENVFAPLPLLSRSGWRPYPVGKDRHAWEAIPPDVRMELVALADRANNGDWPSLLATTALEFKRHGNRSNYDGIQLGRRLRLVDLVLGECASGEGRYLEQIMNSIWLTCEESFWGSSAHLGAQRAGNGLPDTSEPIIDLFSAETAATLALAVYLLGVELSELSPMLVPRVQAEARRRVLEPALRRDDFFWMGLDEVPRRLNNWTPWIDSNWLTAVLLLEEDEDRRKRSVMKICRSADRFLSGYSPDGACEEGRGYWKRSAGSFFDCCSTLSSAHGGRGTSVFTNPFVRAMGRYVLAMHISGKQYVNFGDAHINDDPPPDLMYRYGRADGDGQLAALGAFDWMLSRNKGSVRPKHLPLGDMTELVSLSRRLSAVTCSAELRTATQKLSFSRDAWYPSVQLMTARVREGSDEGFYIAMQAASNGRSHGHNDSGSFLVYLDGQPIFIDVGVGIYEAKTFGPERYSFWTMQSAFHNLPTIGGIMQSERANHKASNAQYQTDDSRAQIRVDLATAYPKEARLKQWIRTLALERNENVVSLQEDFAIEHGGVVSVSFMTSRQPSLKENRVVFAAAGQRRADLAFDDKELQVTIEAIALTHADLIDSWGKTIYRVLLTSLAPVANGNWSFRI